MRIARMYNLVAREGASEADLRSEIFGLVQRFRSIEGFGGAVLLRNMQQSGNVVFIERWPSIGDHIALAEAADREALEPITGTTLTGVYLEYVAIPDDVE